MAIKLIAGLQNPGSQYAQTRHNAGGWFVERLAQIEHGIFKVEPKFKAMVASIEINAQPVKLLLPTTFMNHSGAPVQSIASFYNIKPDEILVAHDELDLSPGRVKLKSDGGHGGHNGLRDIIQKLGSPSFYRLRIGIGHPGHKDLVHSYVLGKPSAADRALMFDAIERAMCAIDDLAAANMALAMNKINS